MEKPIYETGDLICMNHPVDMNRLYLVLDKVDARNYNMLRILTGEIEQWDTEYVRTYFKLVA